MRARVRPAPLEFGCSQAQLPSGAILILSGSLKAERRTMEFPVPVDSRSGIGSHVSRCRCPRSQHGRVRATSAFIEVHRVRFRAQSMCRGACCRSGQPPRMAATADLYSYPRRCSTPSSDSGAPLVASRGIYGTPRAFDLREAGETCSKHRVAWLMREANRRALHSYRACDAGRSTNRRC